MPHGQPHTPPGLLQQNPLDDPNYDYGTILPFRMRNTLDVDELAVPGLLRDVGNSAVSMGQMARGQRPPGLILDNVMDFSPAGLLNRIPAGALGAAMGPIMRQSDAPTTSPTSGKISGEKFGQLMDSITTRKFDKVKTDLEYENLPDDVDKDALTRALIDAWKISNARFKKNMQLGKDPIVGRAKIRLQNQQSKQQRELADQQWTEKSALLKNIPGRELWNKKFAQKVDDAIEMSRSGFNYSTDINRANMEAVPRILKKDGWTTRHTSTNRSGKKSSRYLVSPDGKFEIRLSDHELPMTPQRQYTQSQYGTRYNDEIVLTGNENPLDILSEIRTLHLEAISPTFKAVPGVPVMGLIEQPGGLDIMGQYTGGVI